MSEESTTPDAVQCVRGVIDSIRCREVDRAASFFAPDAVWDGWGSGAHFEGRTAIRGFFEDWLRTFDEYEVEPEQILDLGNGVVFAVVQQEARVAGGMAGTRLREVGTFTFVLSGGMVARVNASPNIDEARAAAERLAESRE